MTTRTKPLRIVGRDGKSYPPRWLPAEDRDWLVGRCHWLKHHEDLSVRSIREHLLYNHRIQRSVGAIASYLARPCERCSGVQNATPEHSVQAGGRR